MRFHPQITVRRIMTWQICDIRIAETDIRREMPSPKDSLPNASVRVVHPNAGQRAS